MMKEENYVRSSEIVLLPTLIKNMNFDKPLFKIYHIETLMRTTIKALEAAMLDIAKATNRFTLDLMKDLTNEIDIY